MYLKGCKRNGKIVTYLSVTVHILFNTRIRQKNSTQLRMENRNAFRGIHLARFYEEPRLKLTRGYGKEMLLLSDRLKKLVVWDGTHNINCRTGARRPDLGATDAHHHYLPERFHLASSNKRIIGRKATSRLGPPFLSPISHEGPP